MELFDAYVFDLDGTVYLGEELLPGVERLITELRALGRPVRFVTNNPTKDAGQYAEKLTRLGLPTPAEDIVTTVVVMTWWLLRHAPNAVVFPIAEEPLVRSFERAAIRMSDEPAEIDIVVASFDRGFDYRKLQIAFDAIWFHRRARLVATNPDPYCPLPGGRGEPDCAAMIAAIEAATGVRCEVNVGKPAPEMLHAALSGLHVPPHRAVMVGDRLATDVGLARAAGAISGLVLTGETRPEDVPGLPEEQRPDVILTRITDLLPTDVPGSS
jgi:HAD superfamily hydrolase (TIGR01450 family)